MDHPASFLNWLTRRSDKLRHDGRPQWQRSTRSEETPRVAVLLHVPEGVVVPKILQRLAVLPLPFDLLVTNATGAHLRVDEADLGRNVREVRILEVPNHGRDVLPMVAVVNAALLEPYDLVLRIQGNHWTPSGGAEERSGAGAERLDPFLADVAQSAESAREILGAFAEDPSLGFITSGPSRQGSASLGEELSVCRELLRRLELKLEVSQTHAAVGSVSWIRSFLLNGLRALDLSHEDFGVEASSAGVTTADAIELAIGLLCEEAGFRPAEVDAITPPINPQSWQRYEPASEMLPEARVFPFYLPQFHRFPENDAWWGTGFSEWNNVAAAKPMFAGHRQPNLPSDFGYYDLADPSVRPRQYDAAKSAGIEGFMYYHYWFAGERLMDMPVEQLVSSADPHPFCLMWANENWTRRWDGGSENVLIAQDHQRVSAERFIDDVMHLITDSRYVRIDGKPLLAVYRITQLPDYESVVQRWRVRAAEQGLPGLFLVSVDVGSHMQGLDDDATGHGLDGTMEFPPHNRRWEGADLTSIEHIRADFSGHIMRYEALVAEAEEALLVGIEPHRFPGVLVNFDNTARRQYEPDLWVGSNPFTFRRWLRSTVQGLQDRDPEQRVIFINAWNEWAEGAVLEPSQRFGRTYLQAVRSAIVCP